MSSKILDEQVPALENERQSYEREVLQEVKAFENKVKSDEYKL